MSLNIAAGRAFKLHTRLTQMYTKRTMSSVESKFVLPQRYHGSEKSVWVEYIQLVQDYNPLNLGQGFPDFAAPDHITKALSKVALADNALLQQYTRGFGHPRLVKALSKLYSELVNREIDPYSEILVTTGAYEALFCTIKGHTDNGDEVIIIEPYYDCYEPMVLASGGVPKFIPLRLKPNLQSATLSSNDWVLDRVELESLFNDKTKAIILNTPNNPLGKVFSLDELMLIAELCKKWNVLCISDEVYEWIAYKGQKHVRIATLPGMWERTITVGSVGKTFNVTGWKTGWAYGPSFLMNNLRIVHQNCIYTCCTPIQEAIAVGLEAEIERLGQEDCYLSILPRVLETKRDMMVKILVDAGMKPTIPDGGYFIMADWSDLESKVDLSCETDKYKDYRFTKWMTKNLGLLGIPPTAFYSEEHKKLAENFVRYNFMKEDKKLLKANEIFQKWKQSM